MDLDWMPFIWVAITLPILSLLGRWIHRHLHGLATLVTGNANWAVILYALILLPGVLLHELSHWITAKLLRVRTGAFSILPKIGRDGTVQLGSVEYYKTRGVGPIRESLIGSAPLVAGTAVVLLITFRIIDVDSLAIAIETGQVDRLTEAIATLFDTSDFLLWLYLLFAISNAMMPSASDRRAWPAFAAIMIAFALVLILLGVQDDLINTLAGPAATVFGHLGLAYSLVIGVDIFFIFIIYVLEQLISRIRGVELVYGRSQTGS
ncbi:MAG: hypothetical protein PVH18_11415 [Chloroflexota bacterium]